MKQEINNYLTNIDCTVPVLMLQKLANIKIFNTMAC
jgi:hypothetical protein